MRILYIAKHGQKNNDDEGAITYALSALGHEVVLCHEKTASDEARHHKADLALVHHFRDFSLIRSLRMSKVFWCFDLIDWPTDSGLWERSRARKNWLRAMITTTDLGFMTDGDAVARDRSGKLTQLCQGADERILDKPLPIYELQWEVLFAGISGGGGAIRESFVQEMRETYGNNFHHVQNKYREELAELVRKSAICVAPDSPVSDSYWSNRIYIMLGFGAFLLHPWSKGLAEQYTQREEIVYYHSRDELRMLVEYYLERPDERARISTNAVKRTLAEHTYRHRVSKLIEAIQSRLGEKIGSC